MSGFGGFGGFGQNNNNQQQQQSTGFGGFGSTNTNTGFGSTGNSGFGSTNTTGGGLFGGGSTGGFGSSGGAFGNTTNNAFGAKTGGFGTPAATTGGSLFGGGTATAGTSGFGGGFGASTAPAAASSPFGGTNSGGGLFGSTKPTFGGSTTTSNPFGGGATNSPFGGTTTSAFGSPASTALGGAVGEAPGTGNVPFQPFIEKEPNSTSNQQNSFQNICFQPPYQKFSPEELRLVDYNQGRRYGNASGQAGAFGASNFGGFGSTTTTNTGGFGATNTNTGSGLFGGTSSSPFGGTSQPATTGFGATASTGGGLFGAKPATGGLFGAQPSQPSGGLFGTNTNTAFGTPNAGGFGTTNTSTGSSLFGASSTANKPFSFGTPQPAASTGTGFGGAPASTGFGGGGLFGNTNQQQNTATGFGNPQPATTAFGGFNTNTQQQTSTPSLFGSNQQKPAGSLFGAAPATGTSLFGSTQPASNTNPFGGSTNTQNTGGLFGSKPASTGTGLFGATNPQNNTVGGGLFGGFGANQNQTQPQTSSLFGSLNNNNNNNNSNNSTQKPSLFGNTGNQQQGGLFGNTGNQQQGGLFGGLNNNNQQQTQQPQNSLFGGGNSLFGSSQQGQNSTPQSLTASIGDNGAFGSSSLFANLQSTQVNNPGPVATPLSSSVQSKKSAALPLYKLNSASASRFTTPSRQRAGFGFSYSNYGSPASASSTASTPGTFGGSMLGGGGTFGRTLNKSMSTSSLRRSFNTEDSILAPGAFSASPGAKFASTGSVKKLTISRSIRQDLFSPPNPQPNSQPPPSSPVGGILKKRVSFDQSTTNGNGNSSSSPLKQVVNGATPNAEDLGLLRPRASVNGAKPDGTAKQPEMEQVANNNKQLAIVNEEESTAPVQPSPSSAPVSQEDNLPGEYWMQPSREEIESMNRNQRQRITDFTVGRHGIGSIHFDVPADLTSVNLDEVVGDTVRLEIRSATVYPNAAKKPPMGRGLNLPATITLANSWPRKKDGKTSAGDKSGIRFRKHVECLKKVGGTKFLDYDKDTGVWTFSVLHFTTYGFPDEDEETDGDAMSEFGQSTFSAPPDTPTPKIRTPRPQSVNQSFASSSQMTVTESDPDDTFEFRKKKALPGAFDDEEVYMDENMQEEDDEGDRESFLDERSVGSLSENGVEEPMDHDDVFHNDESVSIMDQEMAGSYPEADNTAELVEQDSQDDEEMDIMTETPGAIMRARMRALKNSETPSKQKLTVGNDWANTLAKTVSPQKQDRKLLKSLIDIHGNEPRPDTEQTPVARRVISDGRGFATSIDLMNSLFGQTRSPAKVAKVPAVSKGFEWPYAKRAKTGDHDTSDMSENDRAFHDSMRPSWGPDGTLVYAALSNPKPFGKSSRRARERDGLLTIHKGGVVSESRDVRFAKFSNEASAELLDKHKALAFIDDSGSVPFASLPEDFLFSDFLDDSNARDPAAAHEKLVWQLASILFDRFSVPEELKAVPDVSQRLRKDRLSAFWQKLVDNASLKHVALARSNEEKAIAALSGHRVADACAHLIDGNNFRLATLVSLIGIKDNVAKDMREQLNEWQSRKMLSEFSQPIRTLYELVAGNVGVCDGYKGQAEDRVDSFIISKRFGLDWRQAFGLRLWYGITSNDPIENAVEEFAQDLAQDKETSRPHAWYVEQKVPTLWDDCHIGEREDLLWGLLKLFTFEDADIEDILRPENSQLSPLDIRLSWQLSQAITSKGSVQYSGEDNDKADRTTLSFASQLTNEGSWLDAIFVLLHVKSDEARAKSIQTHLAQHADRIGSEDGQNFLTLTQAFKIPGPWIWEAKALYMRSVEKNPRAEVECLIRAGSFKEAHRTFAKEVAPKTVIELDNDTLRTLLDGFKGKENTIPEWHLGGEIYRDYLELLDCEKKGWAIDPALLQRLLAGLPSVVEESRHPGFMETVAIGTISGVVAKLVVALGKKGEKSNLDKVLRLPLTEDKYLKHTVELSLEYYRGVMASAR